MLSETHTPFHWFEKKARQKRPGPTRNDIFRYWAGANFIDDEGIKSNLLKEISPSEFDPGLLKELFQDDRLKRGIMILLEPLTEKEKNLFRNKEMFFTLRATRIKQSIIILLLVISCDQQQTILTFACSRQVCDSSETLA